MLIPSQPLLLLVLMPRHRQPAIVMKAAAAAALGSLVLLEVRKLYSDGLLYHSFYTIYWLNKLSDFMNK
jgi:hypothetical protein